jgi:glycerol-3-phosphate O-acyltransferase
MVKIAYQYCSIVHAFIDPSSAERLLGSIAVVSVPLLTACVIWMYDF